MAAYADASDEHTPGPWLATKCRCGDIACRSYRIGHSGPDGMFREADAKIIAAAPDLVDALDEQEGRT